MLTGFDDCYHVQDNDFEWLWQTSFQDNIHWGFWWALQQSQRVLLGYSLYRWTHQRRPWVRVVSGVRHWCWLLLTLVLELKTYSFPLFSLEGWNVEAKVAQFENYVKDHLRFYKDQVRTDTTNCVKTLPRPLLKARLLTSMFYRTTSCSQWGTTSSIRMLSWTSKTWTRWNLLSSYSHLLDRKNSSKMNANIFAGISANY